MFIIDTTDSFINMDNIESIDIFDYGGYTQITAFCIKSEFCIYRNSNHDKAKQIYEFIKRAILKGFNCILIQDTADYVVVYKKGNLNATEKWKLEVD